MEDIVAFVSWIVMDLLLVSLGRFTVFALSFGRWRGEKFDSSEGRVFSTAGALSFVRDGQRVVTRLGLLLLGLASLGMTLLLILISNFSWRGPT